VSVAVARGDAMATSISRQNSLARTPTKVLYANLERTSDKLCQVMRMVVEAAALAHTAKNDLEQQYQQQSFTLAVREIKGTLSQALNYANECQKRINLATTYRSGPSKSGLILQLFRKVHLTSSEVSNRLVSREIR